MKNVTLLWIIAALVFAVSSVASAQTIELSFNASKHITLNQNIAQIFVGTKSIVKVSQPTDALNEFVITANEKTGSTTVFVWTVDGAKYEYTVNVVDDKIAEVGVIEREIGLPNVRVRKIGGKILLQGTVADDAEYEHVMKIVSLFVDGAKVVRSSNFDSKTGEYNSETREEGGGNVIDELRVLNPSYNSLSPEQKIERTIGLPDVHVKIVDGRILLTGTVKNQYERNQALQIARLYMNGDSGDSLSYGSNLAIDGSSSGSLIDLLQMSNPTQIRLEAQIISINPSDSKNLGVLYGTSSTSGDTRTPAAPGIFYFGEGNYRGSGSRFRSNPWSWLMERHANINISIDALISKTKAKILSRPSITTMSGEEAKIQIGGEIPYQSYSSSGIPSTEFKDYGIMLNFKPIVDAQNRVVTSISVEVSNLSGESVDGQPIIATRSANTVVTLNSGSTMVIGGLMDSSERKVVRKIPLLGDIPIIGEFFKYSSRTRDKQELIILVTPYIVEDTSRAGMSDDMRDYYREGQREKNSLNDVDLNSPPPEIKSRERESQNQSNQSKSAVIFGDAF